MGKQQPNNDRVNKIYVLKVASHVKSSDFV